MSDLDKAIRDQMDAWARSSRDETAALAADRYDAAIRGVLAWARGLESTVPASDPTWRIPSDLRRIISDSLGASGEDRTEPTPARREPRVWRHGVHADIDQDVNDVAGTTTGRHWQRMPGKQFVWTNSGLAYSAGTVLYVENEVAEVVPPEGTP